MLSTTLELFFLIPRLSSFIFWFLLHQFLFLTAFIWLKWRHSFYSCHTAHYICCISLLCCACVQYGSVVSSMGVLCCACVQYGSVVSSDISVLKIISVLVSIKFELNHFGISFYTVSELFSVLVSIRFFLEIISVQFQFQYLAYIISVTVLSSTIFEHRWWDLGGECPPPNEGGVWWGGCQNFFGFFLPRNGAFCVHSDTY